MSDLTVHARPRKQLGAISLAACLIAAVTASSSGMPRALGSAAPDPYRAVNTGLASQLSDSFAVVPVLNGTSMFLPVSERDSGGVDLNGDGDAVDHVAHVYERVWGAVNLGLATPVESTAGPPTPAQPWRPLPVPLANGFAFRVLESGQGEDLNGDGDDSDLVAHVFDPAAGVTNVAVAADVLYANGALAGFGVSEADQGGADLNGDGDSDDRVLHVWSAATGLVNTGAPMCPSTQPMVAFGDGFAFALSTTAVPDPHFCDVALYDPTAGVSSLGVALAPPTTRTESWGPTGLVAGGGGLGFLVREAGTDLNGDGDVTDAVAHAYTATGGVVNVRLAALTVAAGGTTIAYGVDEGSQAGTDLNGDGDTSDIVIHAFAPGGAVTNLGIDGREVAPIADGFGFLAHEDRQGGADLNGDGDASDLVAHLYTPSGGVTNLGLAIGALSSGPARLWSGDAWVALIVSEASQGGVDLNGDGDNGDLVPHAADAAASVANLGVEARAGVHPGSQPLVAFDAGFAFVNGALAQWLRVGQIYHPTLGLVDTHLPANPDALAASPDMLALGVWEAVMGFDLNGDGDTADVVTHVVFPSVYPVAEDDAYVVPKRGVLDEPAPGVLDNDQDPQGDDLTVEWYTDPGHGTVDVFDDGSFVYTHDGAPGSSDSFTYWAGDGTDLSEEATVWITINDPPAAASDGPYLVDAGGTLTHGAPGLLANDSDPDGDPLQAAYFSAADHGVVTVYLDGAFEYVHDGSGGVGDAFTYQITDGHWLSDETTVGITVNQPPAATADGPWSVDRGGTLAGSSVLGNDTDPNGDDLTAVLVAAPEHGTLTFRSDGTFAYVHDGSGAATDRFTYRASDGRLSSDAAIATITVTGVLPAGSEATSVGLVDPSQGKWYLRDYDSGAVDSFFYGNPGDVPFLGDWDCDGEATPGLFRTSDAYAYLRNSNTVGIADIRFFFGDPADLPLAGDFDGDGCDTLSIYRPSEQRFYIMNQLGENEGGLGAADYSFVFGNPGDKPVVGDWDGDGIDEVGLHRESTGFFYYRTTLDSGIASGEFYFGDPGDRFVAGDWGAIDSVETPAVFRPANATFYFRWTNTPGNADAELAWGEGGWLPVSGVID